ncbi:MAG: hypothetical protein ACREND_13575, partial [Gemmatimonadaceae bacterium]
FYTDVLGCKVNVSNDDVDRFQLDVPDAHLYFQAPGGQVFRLVGIHEDLSVYEESLWSKPRSTMPGLL